MNARIFLMIGVAAVAVAGCVGTVNDRTRAGVPFVKDSMLGRYQRPVGEVFEAATAVISQQGTLQRSTTLYETNVVKVCEGTVNQRKVWVRVEAIDLAITQVTVQVRTSGGGTDLSLAHQIEKDIALKLVR